jgi:tetratricopeptide (TPR) repeat protein
MRENRIYEAYTLYSELYPILKYDQFFLFNYGAELSLMNQYDVSIKILKEVEPRLNNTDFYFYLGNNYEMKGELTLAEESYKKAMNIMPVKLMPRYRLVVIYLKTKRKDKAINMANTILNMRIKIRSATTDAIRQEMFNLINKKDI